MHHEMINFLIKYFLKKKKKAQVYKAKRYLALLLDSAYNYQANIRNIILLLIELVMSLSSNIQFFNYKKIINNTKLIK